MDIEINDYFCLKKKEGKKKGKEEKKRGKRTLNKRRLSLQCGKICGKFGAQQLVADGADDVFVIIQRIFFFDLFF